MSYSSAGFLAVASGCRPANLRGLGKHSEPSPTLDPPLAEKANFAEHKNYLLGYPINMNTPPEAFFDWRRQLHQAGIGDFAYNNVGNPYKPSSIPFNTHDFERDTIDRFGQLYGFAPGEMWGFLSHSGTDSNLHGMYMGRTLLKARTGAMPKCYFTREAHYSIQILRDLLGIETVFVETLPDGAMDPGDLGRKLAENRNSPALVVATVGTTFKGAIDSIDGIQEVLRGHSGYLHLDAALFGGYLVHTASAEEVMHRSRNHSGTARYDSIAVSCHKFFGFPAPAGLFITTKTNFAEFNEHYSRVHDCEYIGHVPGTITCSRDSVKPAEFNFFSKPEAVARQAEDARAILKNTDYLLAAMQSHCAHRLPKRASEVSNTVYFRKPADWIVKKYSLATMVLEIGGKKQEYAHVVVMPHASRQVLDDFLTDLEKDS